MPNRKPKSDSLWKVTTKFIHDEDMCHAVYFIWAKDKERAAKIVINKTDDVIVEIKFLEEYVFEDNSVYHRPSVPGKPMGRILEDVRAAVDAL